MMDIDGNMRVWKSPTRGEYYDLSIPSPVNVILMARHTIMMKKAYYLKVCTKLWKFRSWICIFHLCWKLIDEVISYVFIGQVKKNTCFSSGYSIEKRAGGRFFFIIIIYYLLLHAFFTHYFLPPGIRWSS